MFKWPINAATCIGVRPDCETKREQFYSSARAQGRGCFVYTKQKVRHDRREEKEAGREREKECFRGTRNIFLPLL